jgi:succinate dehydrogenase/fumarate reductase flavoprotein subunit
LAIEIAAGFRLNSSQEAIGAKCIDLEWVQVHPTGLVKPDDADAKIKFLAAEVQRLELLRCCFK